MHSFLLILKHSVLTLLRYGAMDVATIITVIMIIVITILRQTVRGWLDGQ